MWFGSQADAFPNFGIVRSFYKQLLKQKSALISGCVRLIFLKQCSNFFFVHFRQFLFRKDAKVQYFRTCINFLERKKIKRTWIYLLLIFLRESVSFQCLKIWSYPVVKTQKKRKENQEKYLSYVHWADIAISILKFH